VTIPPDSSRPGGIRGLAAPLPRPWSTRSAELLARAREGVASARTPIEAGHAATAVSPAYYAMLYAARAALSERDRSARSRAGIWGLFREEFVLTGEFDDGLSQAAQRAQARREASDFAAEPFHGSVVE
jgi:uncharacterized protein (UPF0332 family)